MERVLTRPRLSLRQMIGLVALCAIILEAGVWTWDRYGSPTRRWLRTIRDDNGGSRRWEAADKALLGKDPGVSPDFAVAGLIDALKSPHWNVRADAAGALGQGGRPAERAVPALIAALNDPYPSVRSWAARSLGEILRRSRGGPDQERLIATLLGALGDRSPAVRSQAITYLALSLRTNDHPNTERIARAFETQLRDPDWEVRVHACWALARLGRGKVCVPVLIETLGDARISVRYQAVWTLSQIGPEAEDALPALDALSRTEPVEFVRKEAVGAIATIGKPEPIAEDADESEEGAGKSPGPPEGLR
jgi:HEAT repeat protein